MSTSEFADLPFIQSILHPTDLSAAGQQAFAHALAIALLRHADLSLLHVGSGADDAREWRRFPRVRETLERWNLLEKGSARSAVLDQLDVRVEKVNVKSKDTAGAVAQYAHEKDIDLIVIATEARDGLPRWVRPSIAADAARRSRAMTLFVPKGGRGIVSQRDGHMSFARALVPYDLTPSPGPALEYAARFAEALDAPGPVHFTLLHVGDGAPPPVEPRESPACSWSAQARSGDVAEQIVEAAQELPADLIVMTTEGREGFLDALRGSVTEQVLRKAPCPVLAVPADIADR